MSQVRSYKGRKPGAASWTAQDDSLLLTITREVLPRGAMQWRDVTVRFNQQRSGQQAERLEDGLKARFRRLIATPKPSGDGVVPGNVREALDVQRLIEDEIQATTLGFTAPSVCSLLVCSHSCVGC